MKNRDYFERIEAAFQEYANVKRSGVEDIAIVNAEREVFDLIVEYGNERAAAERERCARVAERRGLVGDAASAAAAERIAAAIRALS